MRRTYKDTERLSGYSVHGPEVGYRPAYYGSE